MMKNTYDHFKLKITIPVIDEFTVPQFENEFSRYSYIKEYWRSFVFPDRVDYTFGYLINEGVENMLETLRALCDLIFEKKYYEFINYTVEKYQSNTDENGCEIK